MLEGLGKEEKVWMSHGDTVYALPDDFEELAHTENGPVAAFRHKQKPIYGLQWHPEVIHTKHMAPPYPPLTILFLKSANVRQTGRLKTSSKRWCKRLSLKSAQQKPLSA